MLSSVALPLAYRLLNHGPTTLISSASNGTHNIMAAAWVCALDFAPPKVTAVIDKHTFTRELISQSGTFAINIPCSNQINIVRQAGQCSGRDLLDHDKFKHLGIATFPANYIDAPLVSGCVGWLECRVLPEEHVQDTYDLFIAEVIYAQADTRVFSDGRWHFEGHEDLRTIHHVAGGAFLLAGEQIERLSSSNED